MFSAVALVAFSFAGMANEKNQAYDETTKKNCLEWAYDQVAIIENVIGIDLGWETEMTIVLDILDDCPQ